jgi:hypothetical protein
MSISFFLNGVTATIQNPDLEDKRDLDLHQAVQPKAGGGFYRFALAAAADSQRALKWSNLRLSELADLASFFENSAQGTLKEFTFTDERGTQYAAYFLDAKLAPVTVSDDAASTGTFVSGGATAPTTTRSGGFYALTIKLHLTPGTATTESATTFPPTTGGPTMGPTTSGPTASHSTAPPAPEFIISLAGTAAANGNYFTAGTFQGFPYYEKEGGGAVLWSNDSSGSWYLGASISADTAWYYGMFSAPSPAGMLFAFISGASPAPLVAAG